MEETVVSLETAKLLKEKGFSEETFAYYNDMGELKVERRAGGYLNWNIPFYLGDIHSAPTQALAQKWLRDTQRAIVLVDYDSTDTKYWCNITYMDSGRKEAFIMGYPCNTYETALEEGLKQTLKLI